MSTVSRFSLFLFSLLLLPLSLHSEVLTDPTRPPFYQPPSSNTVNKPSSQQPWVLHSTLISPQQRLAVINGKTLAVGDEINGATVTIIDHQSVELSVGDKTTILSLQKSFIEHIK